MSKLPYFPCYARDVLSSSKIALMSGDAFKAYWILLCASWLEDERATLPNNEAKLEALARVDASSWLRIKNEVLACFDTAGNGRLFSPRLLEVSLLQEKRREAGSRGGSKTQAGDEATYEANFKQTTKRQSQSSESELEPKKEKEKELSQEKENKLFLEYKNVLDKDSKGIYLETKKNKRLKGKILEAFFLFWEAFGYKHGLRAAADAWLKIKWPEDRTSKNKVFADIVKSAREENDGRDEKTARGSTPKMAEGWITARRWEDEETNG